MHDAQTAVITGAASGIGRALATILTERGARLVLADRDESALRRVAEELTAAEALTVDVADSAAVDALAEAAGPCDLLCLNAGTTSPSSGAVWETDPDEWWRVLGTNLGGVVNGLASFVPRMLERATPSSILITGSLAGVATWPGGGPYAASKHAVVAVAEQAALSLADTQISVSVLCPALVRTGMSDDGEDAAVVAGRALEAVGSGRFAIIPEEWTDAVRRRVHDLAGGNQPSLPAPTTPAGSTGPTGRGRHLGVQPTEGDRGPASS